MRGRRRRRAPRARGASGQSRPAARPPAPASALPSSAPRPSAAVRGEPLARAPAAAAPHDLPTSPRSSFSYIRTPRASAASASASVRCEARSASSSRLCRSSTPLLGLAHTVGFCRGRGAPCWRPWRRRISACMPSPAHRASAGGAYLGGRWPPLRRAGEPLPVKLLGLLEELGLELDDRRGADVDLFRVLRHRTPRPCRPPPAGRRPVRRAGCCGVRPTALLCR